MTRYLVIETAYLGDVIIALTIARALKQADPSASITYLVRPDAGEVAAASPDVDAVIVFDKRGAESGHGGIAAKVTELNEIGFDCVISSHSSDRTRAIVAQLKASRKIGFVGRLSGVLTDAVTDEGWEDRYQRALLLTRPILGNPRDQRVLPGDQRVLPRLTGTPRVDVDRFAAGHLTICLAPGSAWMTKRWPEEYFVTLAEKIVTNGGRVIVIGSPDERSVGKKIAEASKGLSLDITGKATLLEAAYAISRSSLLVANDSSPTHLAVAVGTPVLTLFGPTVPEFGFGPPVGTGTSLGIDLWCRPCTPHGSRECPVHTHECMRGLSVASVYQTSLSLTQSAIESF